MPDPATVPAAVEAPSSEPVLNLKQVALRLGLHYMTVYRYVRQGRLAAERWGTEWRVSELAVAELVQARASPMAFGRPDESTGWSLRMERCLLAGDEPAAWRVIEDALAAARPPDFCYVEILGEALASVGERWAGAELSVADQHIAVGVAWRIVARLGARFRRPGRSRGMRDIGRP